MAIHISAYGLRLDAGERSGVCASVSGRSPPLPRFARHGCLTSRSRVASQLGKSTASRRDLFATSTVYLRALGGEPRMVGMRTREERTNAVHGGVDGRDDFSRLVT